MRLERKNSTAFFILSQTEKEAFKMKKPYKKSGLCRPVIVESEELEPRKQYKKLTYADRQTIERMSKQGAKVKEIAEATDTHITTIYRELQRGADAEGVYKAELAQQALFC